MLNLKETNFDSNVAEGITIVDFWAEWCGPCKVLGPILEELEKENQGIKISKVNIDECPELSNRFQVRGIPTMVMFRDGMQIDVKVGLLQKTKIQEWINKNNI